MLEVEAGKNNGHGGAALRCGDSFLYRNEIRPKFIKNADGKV